MVQTASMSLHLYGQQEQERALEELRKIRDKYKHHFNDEDFSWVEDGQGQSFDNEDGNGPVH